MNNFQTTTNTLPAKLKAERPMPKWVTAANERIGPKPPAPPPNTINGAATPRPPALPPKTNQAEPDYEVIEFSGQQYSNETMRPKTPDTRRPESAMKCTLCGSNNPWVTCDECAQQIFCASCDDMFHKHPKRKTHLRKAIEFQRSTNSTPLIPPKAAPAPQAPVAPPRRNKKGMPSPMPLRRDQVIGSPAPTPTSSPVPGQPQQAWQDRLGSLKRGLNLSTRPLPETPRTPSDGVSSRSTTPNSKSVFDTIQRPPSITLEKIKNKASATLDRMALLQQRYRQHKEAKAIERQNGQPGVRRDQLLPSDQWSNISSPSHFRSGSMSSGINSFDFPDDPPFHFHQQMGMRNSPAARNMSTSVFNLNQVGQRPTDNRSPMWMGGGNQMQQAQSMAQLNCINCSNHRPWNQPHQHDEWLGASNTNLNRSQMSLNMPHGYYPNPQQMMAPPPVFMNMPGMYPYPMGVGIPAMNPGMMGMPLSTRSRATSRAGSRVPSPTLSRKSMQVRKKRNNYTENELTDDEDSENDDRRSLLSQRSGVPTQRRTRRVSSASQALPLEEEKEPRSLRNKILTSRDRRGASIPKSVQSEWTPMRRTSAASTNFNSYKKVYSDSPISPDSEASEPAPTRALVQAKIQEKMKESNKPNHTPKAEPIPISHEVEQQLEPDNPVDDFEYPNDNQYQNANELKLEINQKEEIIDAEDTASLGPPPSTPENEWECEFCTFVNEAKTKICSICCKTPISPITKEAAPTTKPSPVTNGTIKSKSKVSQSEEESAEDYVGAKKKENATVDDIWAALDENIQAEAIKVKRNAESNTIHKSKDKGSNLARTSNVPKEKKAQKVSTGCGPSPPKEIPKELRSTATSPVPQSISTQTYDSLPARNEPEHEAVATSTEMPISDHQQSASYTPPTRNFSPKEIFTPLQDTAASREAEHFASLERNLRFYRDMSVAQTDRYRSSTDIRFDDHPPSVHHRRPSVSDYLASQKAQMYHNDNFFDQYSASKRNEPTRDPEIELFMLLKEAEHYKFTAEELHAALKHCGDTHPIAWLRENWSKLVQTVQSLATKYGQERIENVIGTISAIEAREALRMHGGNVWQAISECVEQRQRKYLEISAKGNYSREDIVTALTAHHGNLELALLDLSKTQLKPFLMRVWGSPGGVENESANYMPPPPPKTEVNSAIHEFLSANADQLTYTQDQGHFRNTSSVSNLSSWSHESKDDTYNSQNRYVLKDLEILIGNMEQVQAKQNEQILRSVEDMLGNLLAKKPVEAEMDVDADADAERIFMKSPILSAKSGGNFSNNATDVKNFVWQHIQEIVPNLVEQVEKELLQPEVAEVDAEREEERPEPPPIDAEEFIMEEVIRPNLKHSTLEEEPQVELQEVSAMPNFSAEVERSFFRKQREENELNSFANAPRTVFKMAIAPESDEEESTEETSVDDSSEEEESKETPSVSNQKENIRQEVLEDSSEEESGQSQEELPRTNVKQETGASVEVKKTDIEPETHLKAPEEEQTEARIVVKDPEEQNAESDESENKPDKGWGFRGFSFKGFGFSSFGRSRRQRTRRSVKRERRKVEEDTVQTETSTEPDQMNSNEAASASTILVKSVEIQLEEAPSTSIGVAETPKQSEEQSLQKEAPQGEIGLVTNSEQVSVPQKAKAKKTSSLPRRKQTKQQKTTSESEAATIEVIETTEDLQESAQNENDNLQEPSTSSKHFVEQETTKTDVKINNEIAHEPTKSSKISKQTKKQPKNEKSKQENAASGSVSKKTEAVNEAESSNLANKTTEEPSTSTNYLVGKTTGVESKPQEINTKKVEVSEKPSISSKTKAKKTKLDTADTKSETLSTENDSKPSAETRKTNEDTTDQNTQQKLTMVEKDAPKTESSEKTQSSEASTASKSMPLKKKPISRIPVRRTPSSASLTSIENIPTSPTSSPNVNETLSFDQQSEAHPPEEDEFFDDIQSSSDEEPDFHNAIEEIPQPTIAPITLASSLKDDEENSDQELYSVESEELNIDNTRDLMQSPTSPTSESEVFLILENENSLPLVTPSASSSTITAMSNKSIDFKYSDPSKQNLSELVEDTQRLIKQMKEEINIDMAAFDSEDEYSDEFSSEDYEEEYEEEDEEEEYDENTNAEEEYDEEEETENEEEYSNVELDSAEDRTHDNEDLQEVDEMQYIDEEEDEEAIESLQVTLNHTPSIDHLPSIVDSSISKESLTNPSHVISTDHNTSIVSVLPGLIPKDVSESVEVDSHQNSESLSETNFSTKISERENRSSDSLMPTGARSGEVIETTSSNVNQGALEQNTVFASPKSESVHETNISTKISERGNRSSNSSKPTGARSGEVIEPTSSNVNQGDLERNTVFASPKSESVHETNISTTISEENRASDSSMPTGARTVEVIESTSSNVNQGDLERNTVFASPKSESVHETNISTTISEENRASDSSMPTGARSEEVVEPTSSNANTVFASQIKIVLEEPKIVSGGSVDEKPSKSPVASSSRASPIMEATTNKRTPSPMKEDASASQISNDEVKSLSSLVFHSLNTDKQSLIKDEALKLDAAKRSPPPTQMNNQAVVENNHTPSVLSETPNVGKITPDKNTHKADKVSGTTLTPNEVNRSPSPSVLNADKLTKPEASKRTPSPVQTQVASQESVNNPTPEVARKSLSPLNLKDQIPVTSKITSLPTNSHVASDFLGTTQLAVTTASPSSRNTPTLDTLNTNNISLASKSTTAPDTKEPTNIEMATNNIIDPDSTPALITALEQLLHTNSSSVNENQSPAKESPSTETFPQAQEASQSVESHNSPSSSTVSTTPTTTSPSKSPPKKIASKIPKLNVKQNPVPNRSKSFSGPSPIGISSVRAIQQELFNKPKPATQPLKPAPPPTLVRKKSIIDAISKFTQVTAEHPVQRSRTQPKIPKLPKKKYHETCFSDDDYQATTSEDEEPTPLEVRLRKQSVPVFRTYPSIIESQIEKPEVLARRFVDEQLVANMAEAHLAAALVGMKFQQEASIWAAKECADLDQAISMLQQECELCMGSYPMNQIVSMLKCTHKCCKVCAKNYFTIQITDRSINDCNCPFCKTPELHDPTINEDENLEYFSNLDIFIKNIVEPEVHELFQRKLRDRTLMQDPNFKWCIQCSSGFFARPKQKRLICPDCGSVTCSQCRKTWEKQHESLSCEKFQEWKEANDPEIQAKGVAEHLAINGIDCPKCHFKYSLARGGCMHFTCTQCKHEFCYGCSKPFMMGAKCTISPYCSKLGLHSHHPRSCLFYLRDKDPGQLQNLLKQNNVTFDVDPAGFDKAEGARSLSKCPIPLQKETPKGLVDAVCNADVQENHAGLCRQHYVEYLAGKVSKAGIDPLPILDLTDCVQELRRRGLPLPERGPWDTDEIYRNMCSEVIRAKIPIE